MKLTTKSRYGLRACALLATAFKKGPVSASFISEEQHINLLYLEQLLNKLKRSGIVKSVRGAQGGYILAKEPSRITIYDIMRTLEGDLSLEICLSEDNRDTICSNIKKCRTQYLWKRLNDYTNNVLKAVTLDDIEDEKSCAVRIEKKLSAVFK